MRKRSGRPPRFAAIPNQTIDDSLNLDLTALGLLAVLLRHQDGWEITLAKIGEKYGYGRDALANAMGQLQVARYVVKVRIQTTDGNLWSTELYVYDIPATQAEVEALLDGIRSSSQVRRAEVIEPTSAAGQRAAKRREKLTGPKRRTTPSVTVPRLSENPHSGATCENGAPSQVDPECGVFRQSGDPALSKKTVGEKTNEKTAEAGGDAVGQGDGGFARTGAGDAAEGETGPKAGGSAASGPIPTPRQSQQPSRSRTVKTQPRRMPPGYEEVRAAIPHRVARPGTELYVGLRRAIADLLTGNANSGIPRRTQEQVIARINRRWHGERAEQRCQPGYSPTTNAEGEMPIKNPSSWLAAAILAQDCPDPGCEDGVLLGSREPCTACRERRAEEAAARRASAQMLARFEQQRAAEADHEAARSTTERTAAEVESGIRETLAASGMYGELLEYHVQRRMTVWRDGLHPSPAGPQTPAGDEP